MTKRDWWIASLLIAIGLHCLVMSGIISASANVPSYLHLLFSICLWMGIPLLAGVMIYIIVSSISKKKGRKT